MELAFQDLLNAGHGDSFKRMLTLFSSSGALQDLHRQFQEFETPDSVQGKSGNKVLDAVKMFENGGAHVATSESARNKTFFQDIYQSFSSELHHVGELEKRLQSRDEYLQSTITETAKRCHSLEQKIADLESENEDLRNDYLNLEARTQMQGNMPSPAKLQRAGSVKSARAQKAEASKEATEEKEVSRWIRELTNTDKTTALDERVKGSSRRKSVVERDAKDQQELIKLTQNLTTLAEEKELLEHDLTLIRLQVEHLESISKERDAIIADLMNRRTTATAPPMSPPKSPFLQLDIINKRSSTSSMNSPLSPHSPRINSISSLNKWKSHSN